MCKKLFLAFSLLSLPAIKEVEGKLFYEAARETCANTTRFGWLMIGSGSVGTMVFCYFLPKVVKRLFGVYREKYEGKSFMKKLFSKAKSLLKRDRYRFSDLVRDLVFVISCLLTWLFVFVVVPAFSSDFIDFYDILKEFGNDKFPIRTLQDRKSISFEFTDRSCYISLVDE